MARKKCGIRALGKNGRSVGLGMSTEVSRRSTRPSPVRTSVEGDWMRRHKMTGQAYVLLPGPDGSKARRYVGQYYLDDGVTLHPLSLERAGAALRESRVLGGAVGKKDGPLTVEQLVCRFTKYVNLDRGSRGTEAMHYKLALDFLVESHGSVAVEEFGPLRLLEVQGAMAESGRWCRSMVNSYVWRVRRCIKWGVSRELVPPSVLTALEAVEGLRKGRGAVREGKKVGPVLDEHVAAILPFVSRQVSSMVQLQRATGMRSGEMVQMTPADLDRSGEVWVYRPPSHKTQHLGHDRLVFMGPKARAIVEPFLLRSALAPCFSPREAEQERLQALSAKRATPINQGNQPGSNRKSNPRKMPGDSYSTASFRRAIGRACDKAGIPRWTPHQLRHAAATEIRKAYGLEGAGSVLGQADLNTTQIYAEINHDLARRIASEVG